MTRRPDPPKRSPAVAKTAVHKRAPFNVSTVNGKQVRGALAAFPMNALVRDLTPETAVVKEPVLRPALVIRQRASGIMIGVLVQ